MYCIYQSCSNHLFTFHSFAVHSHIPAHKPFEFANRFVCYWNARQIQLWNATALARHARNNSIVTTCVNEYKTKIKQTKTKTKKKKLPFTPDKLSMERCGLLDTTRHRTSESSTAHPWKTQNINKIVICFVFCLPLDREIGAVYNTAQCVEHPHWTPRSCRPKKVSKNTTNE